MSDRGRVRTPPGLNRQDLELWHRVTEGVDPIDPSRPDTGQEIQFNGKTPPSPGPDSPPPSAPVRRHEPGLSGIDRRTRQRLSRGQMEADARIDLHGLTQAQARIALRAFLCAARARGHRLVLVITGKGAAPFARHTLHSGEVHRDPDRPGVLRRALPQWLGEPEFRDMVTGFQPAHPKHGGGGACYLRLRRIRGSGRCG